MDLEAADINKVTNEEYKLWKKNSPFLYDLVITHALDWPSLTIQWFPDVESPPDKDYDIHRVLLGTHTSDNDKNYLQIATVHLPRPSNKSEVDKNDYDADKGEIGRHADTTPRVKIVQQINHEGEVNRARYMPQNPNLLATKTVKGEVFIFDRTKHPNQPAGDDCKPDIRLRGQTKEGYGLAWNPHETGKGRILSASEDTTVAEWDINAYTKQNNTLEPTQIYRGHSAVVEDVAWHVQQDNIFASVGDDRLLLLWDTRDGSKPASRTEAHTAEVNCVAFAPHSGNHLITGSGDKTIALWDLRNLKQSLHSFIHHEDEVLQLAWSPTHETIFASGSSDRRILLWDVSKIGFEQTPDDAEDGPPELLFMHGGHTSKPTDLSWNPAAPWVLASTAEDNIIQAWQPNRNIYAADEVPIAIDDLE